jgi:sulfur-oxidizing protein SoxX
MSRTLVRIGTALLLLGGALGAVSGRVDAQGAAAPSGEAIAFDRSKGNCLACHAMRGSDVPSNVGPELNDMKTRFPDRADLVAILINEEARNPQTVMPSFGRNLILTPTEIEQIVNYLYTL